MTLMARCQEVFEPAILAIWGGSSEGGVATFQIPLEEYETDNASVQSRMLQHAFLISD